MKKTNQQTKKEVKPKKRENVFINILFNIIIPSLILMKLSKPQWLGPVYSLMLAICFPVSYGIYDLVKSRKWNFFSIVGIFNVSLTGGFSLMQLNGFWFAVKGAAEPLIFALATLFSLKTRYPLVKTILLNPGVMHVELINERIKTAKAEKGFGQLLVKCTYMVAGSFLLSMVTHFVLAISILKSAPGTPEFNAELGYMTSLGFPVNALPAMIVLGGALWYLFSGIKKLTGLDFNEIIIDHQNEPAEIKSNEKSI
ncbi:MAG: MFS transporter [Spirochaetia bacterium]|nr:MFS transporter [Spirochaetia bacterium]